MVVLLMEAHKVHNHKHKGDVAQGWSTQLDDALIKFGEKEC